MSNVRLYMPTIAALRLSLEAASSDAKALFWEQAQPKSRDDFIAKGKLGDNGTGAVYAYFAENGDALYVGEAGRPIKHAVRGSGYPSGQPILRRTLKSVRPPASSGTAAGREARMRVARATARARP